MITQQALEEVRGGVMGKLRQRRAAKRGALVCVAVMCLALWTPVKETKAPQIAEPVLVSKVVAPIATQSVSSSPVTYKAATVKKRVLPVKKIVKQAAPPAYFKILTDDPNVVFLLVNSEDGGTE